MLRACALGLLLTSLVGCARAHPPDGRFACGSSAECPSDYVCVEARCWRTPPDAGSSDVSVDSSDACAALDLCNGVDDDCDPTTVDGASDPMNGAACDGDDRDLCDDDVWRCVDGSLACVDQANELRELCDGVDNDCDADTADGADEGALGDPCDGLDGCFGSLVCEAGEVFCDLTPRDEPERCNAFDDNCDGQVDELGCEGCDRFEHAGGVYLFCGRASTFLGARGDCDDFDYEMVTVDDAAENEFLLATRGGARLWLGLNDRAEEGEFEWGGVPSSTSYRNWEEGEPNGRGGENCVQLIGDRGRWYDVGCTEDAEVVCELPPY